MPEPQASPDIICTVEGRVGTVHAQPSSGPQLADGEMLADLRTALLHWQADPRV